MGKQDNSKNPKYVQISVDTYAHLTGLEDQVKSYEDKVKKYEDKVKKYEDQLTIYKDRVKEYDEQMTSYDDKVKELEDVVEELNEKLSTANLEMVTKESLVKKHAKVAEEAVTGLYIWCWSSMNTSSHNLIYIYFFPRKPNIYIYIN